ncbi:hypothetical protein T440DRAFT_401879 [Plenodomus tracheiphilus IPT5]|uniref:Uncharacterized protein n=1 Tax=Plenodomus tracheiphilus IPT5 TaxID=1408161 RepID=A0A6A7AZ76_9PLEO|nr:hypothetical protein T440DRAFT_401879 [Plenodomus tracheiphilus IPT5]
MSGQMLNSQIPRRASRSSGTQPVHRSSRVEKPRSHQNSPRTMERRKTTTENKLYATLDDHFRMMFGVSPEEPMEERPQPSRPVSWHPSSNQFQASRSTNYLEPMPQHGWSQQYSPSSRNSNHGSDFYSLSTRNSMYEPGLHAPLQSTSYDMHRGSDDSEVNWQASQQQNVGYAHSAVNTPVAEPLPWYLQQWAQQNQAQAMMNPHTRSTDFLPIQHPIGQDEDMEEDDGEKLVALGLYDTPEPSLTWGSPTEATGKGLKLEETWQPPTNDEDDEDEEDADDASSEASVEEPSPPLPPTNPRSQQIPVHVKSHTPGSMEGQSFFFDEDETVSKEWWFQQLKQPDMPAQEAGLGYGWL